MFRPVAWDTWAFLESALDGPRRADVEALLDETDVVITVREVVAETFTFIARRTKRNALAVGWWRSLLESRVRVLEPPLADIFALAGGRPQRAATSFADLSLAVAALAEGAVEVASEDAGFRQLKLTPVFARR